MGNTKQKTSMQIARIFLVGAVGMALMACGQKKDDAPATVRRAGDRYVQQGGDTIPRGTNYVSTSSWINLQGDGIKNMLMASMTSDSIGTINPTNGAIVAGYVELDANGNVIPANSKIGLEVRDSYMGQTQEGGASTPAIQIRLAAASGTANNGQVNLLFKDAYGEIIVTGSYANAGGNFNGQISFRNYKSTVAGMENASGVIGTFSIPTCGFFRCQ